ncbi:hypothetical protein LOTGIDRAFT_155509 [Lottia gigantea]|uniref:Uncharacterized protein n=1 Tax=Lottia gigantea TaxID=225164 RepID=V3ZNX5_LOTGI|nr:hypothetical protein LOTGIDRAFT_155509 [Lottia gigantea]ESO84185.1 hypothetical protein LOTGIDRAFT_155509 [Lottia gigantea]
MFPKPKSAPPRMNSKRISNRTNAMKEIEAWVKKDDDPLTGSHETSRMAGQLTDNITEERMLKAKLWELSKERYKFIAQNSYEQKIFLDRMMKKSSAIRRILSANDDKPCVTYSRIKSSSIRHALLERLDPTNREEKWLGMSSSHSGGQFVTSLPPPPSSSSSTPASLPPDPRSETDTRIPRSCIDTTDNLPSVTVRKDTPTIPHHKDLLVRRKHRKSHFPKFQEDPRYSELQQRLSPIVKKQANIDIYSVVTKIESLHVKPKLPSESRSKVDKKAVAYMRKRGFVFP